MVRQMKLLGYFFGIIYFILGIACACEWFYPSPKITATYILMASLYFFDIARKITPKGNK